VQHTNRMHSASATPSLSTSFFLLSRFLPCTHCLHNRWKMTNKLRASNQSFLKKANGSAQRPILQEFKKHCNKQPTHKILQNPKTLNPCKLSVPKPNKPLNPRPTPPPKSPSFEILLNLLPIFKDPPSLISKLARFYLCLKNHILVWNSICEYVT